MPNFLQELMGYTAWRAGLMMMPRAGAAMFSMFAVGQVARLKVDTRPMVGLGLTRVSSRREGHLLALVWVDGDVPIPASPGSLMRRSRTYVLSARVL